MGKRFEKLIHKCRNTVKNMKKFQDIKIFKSQYTMFLLSNQIAKIRRNANPQGCQQV